MKRHTSLIPLSREHHSALILAKSLQKDTPTYKGMPSDAEEKVKSAQKFYEEELIQHFEEEEKILKLIKGVNAAIDLLSETILREHEELKRLFKSLDTAKDLTVSLDTLGKMLENHIRKEERQLFPLIQESCDDQTMNEIEKAISG